jgi:hypothetical protein
MAEVKLPSLFIGLYFLSAPLVHASQPKALVTSKDHYTTMHMDRIERNTDKYAAVGNKRADVWDMTPI